MEGKTAAGPVPSAALRRSRARSGRMQAASRRHPDPRPKAGRPGGCCVPPVPGLRPPGREPGPPGQRQRAAALAHLRQAVDLLPCSAEAHDDWGPSSCREGRLDEAAAEIRRALGDGSRPPWRTTTSVTSFSAGRGPAIEQYVEALRLQPSFPLAQANLEQRSKEPVGTERPASGGLTQGIRVR